MSCKEDDDSGEASPARRMNVSDGDEGADEDNDGQHLIGQGILGKSAKE